MPVTSMKPHAAYYAKRSVEKQHMAVYTEKFLSLPRFLHDTQAKNPGTWFKFTAHPDTGVFRGVFVSFGPAATLLRSFGRNVSGADFGHSSSYVFEGVYALGIHQTGSGVLIPLWAACFGGDWMNEKGASWQFCGQCIQESGIQDLYPMGHTHFTDRHKGASFFDDFIPGIISCNCALHILQNTRKNAPVAQKGFHDNMFWAVQGAKSLGEYFCNLTKFQNNFPQVKQYLESIPREQWVHFAQLAAGAHTYGWRTSNMAESGQSWAKKMRSMHPLDFCNAFFTKCSIVVTRELQNQKKWAQNAECSAAGLVPWAVNKAKEMSLAGRNVQVVQIGTEQYQCQYYDATTAAAHVRRSLNLTTASCTCLAYQTYRFPCKEVFACLQATRGEAWIAVVNTFNVYVDPCFRLKPDMEIVMEAVIAPDMELLVMMRNSDYAMALSLENADLGLPLLVPPVDPPRARGARDRRTAARDLGRSRP